MREPVWIDPLVVEAVHEYQIAEHGGSGGIRDRGLLDSALNRPRNLFAYGDPDEYQLAASYASGIIQNHPFVDGNKRTGFVIAVLFLARNGKSLEAEEAEAVQVVLDLAAGTIDEKIFAAWLKQNCRPL